MSEDLEIDWASFFKLCIRLSWSYHFISSFRLLTVYTFTCMKHDACSNVYAESFGLRVSMATFEAHWTVHNQVQAVTNDAKLRLLFSLPLFFFSTVYFSSSLCPAIVFVMELCAESCPLCTEQEPVGSQYDTWLQCDACALWYHSDCLKIPAVDCDAIEIFHCPACVPTHGPSTGKTLRFRFFFLSIQWPELILSLFGQSNLDHESRNAIV